MRELPEYRAVLAVDVKNFSGRKAVDHHQLSAKIPLILKRAFEGAGYASVWAERRFPASTGDGFVAGFRPEVLPILLGPVIDGLQEELAYHHELRGDGPRMRVSICVGPLTDTGDGLPGDGTGAAMVEVHRLLDCEPVRSLLEESDPDVTFVAAVISGRVYDDVVASGYTTKAAAEFIPVPVQVKSYQGTVFLHVPRPSGRLLTQGLGVGKKVVTEPEPVHQPDRGKVANTIHGDVSGQVLQAGDIDLGQGTFIVGGASSGTADRHPG